MKYRMLRGYNYAITEDENVPTKIIGPIVTPYIRINNGTMTTKDGYAWDGASGPAIDTKTFMLGSLVHDAYYQLMREGNIARKHRKYADQELRRLMLEAIEKVYLAMSKRTSFKRRLASAYKKAGKFRAWYVYHIVRLTGKKHTFPRKNPRGRIIEI